MSKDSLTIEEISKLVAGLPTRKDYVLMVPKGWISSTATSIMESTKFLPIEPITSTLGIDGVPVIESAHFSKPELIRRPPHIDLTYIHAWITPK